MTVKRVVCPKCNQAMNVVATMNSVRCQSCQHIFHLDASGQAKTPTESARTGNATQRTPSSADADSGKARGIQAIIAVGCILALALVGLAILAVVSSNDGGQTAPQNNSNAVVDPSDSESVENPPSDVASTENSDASGAKTQDYRVVSISEAARKRVYTAYRQTFDSSLGKSKKIPQGGKAGQSLNSMLGQTVDREITHLSLLNNLSEDDVRQIIAEGNAKGWK